MLLCLSPLTSLAQVAEGKPINQAVSNTDSYEQVVKYYYLIKGGYLEAIKSMNEMISEGWRVQEFSNQGGVWLVVVYIRSK